VNLFTFIAKNALRNRRRLALTISSVAVSCALLVTLQTLQRELTVPPESEGASLRIIARNKVSLMQPLPSRQLSVIEKIPGVVAVSPFTYFGGNYAQETVTSFAQFAVDPVRFRDLMVESRIVAGDYDEFIRDRTSCLVGADTIKRYGLKVGDKMRFTGTFYPFDPDLTIAAVFEGTVDDRGVFFHHKLLDEATDGGGTVGTWYLRVASAEVSSDVITAVNQAFANSSAEVRAETERAFQMSFVSMLGDVKTLTLSVSTVVVFTLMLVTVSTMSM
jgi:putative ABC transport system permease protein